MLLTVILRQSAVLFIVADTPGHEEYTRNMAVGASFCRSGGYSCRCKPGCADTDQTPYQNLFPDGN